MATNMKILEPSRTKPKCGDVFVMELSGETFVHGRVVAVDVIAGGFPGAILIYLFGGRSATATLPPMSALHPDHLLVPPIMTNRLPWSLGYFQTLANFPLSESQVLPRHCFRSSRGRYFDELGVEMPGPVEPCGDWGLNSFRTIDDQVSDALSIPRALDD